MDKLLRKAYELLMYAQPDDGAAPNWMDECDSWFKAVEELPGHIRGPDSADGAQ